MNIGIVSQSWTNEGGMYRLLVPIPGVSNPLIDQEGRKLHITGTNPTYNLTYKYTIDLHPESGIDVNVVCVSGMIVLTSPKLSTYKRVLLGEGPNDAPVA
mgnify:CR=1 FL=1